MNWDPLEEPDTMTSTLRRWRSALKFVVKEITDENMQIDIYGSEPVSKSDILPYVYSHYQYKPSHRIFNHV